MDFVEYMKIKQRMTKTNEKTRCNINCFECPLANCNNGANVECNYFEFEYPERAEAIIQKWAKEHPPNVPLDDYEGTPAICPHEIGYDDTFSREECCLNECIECWNQPVPEKEEKE